MFRDTSAFSGFSVNSLREAKEFYGNKLGMEITESAGMPVLNLQIKDSSHVLLYEKSNHTPATFTVLNFPVPDIEKAVSELKSKGVPFESYDWPGFKTDDDDIFRGGGPLIAWFTDPAGNILSVIQE